MRRTASCVIIGLIVLSGCRPDDQGAATPAGVADPSSVTASAAPENLVDASARPCSLLTTRQVADLLGESVGGRGIYEDQDGLVTCRVGSVPGLGLEMGAVPGSMWATSFPDLLEEVGGAIADRPEALRTLTSAADAVSSGAGVSDDEACGVFRALATALLGPENATSFVRGLPDDSSPESLFGQACREGIYATLTVSRPGITASAGDVERVRSSLDEIVDYVAGE